MTGDTYNSKDAYKDKDTTELILLAREGDRLAQSKLVENNIGLVWSIVQVPEQGHETETCSR